MITASSAGTLIEWYDFFIFGSLASIISTQFFPKENPTAAFLATLATFSAGLIIRPLGALIFGRLGDRIGRKYTFMITLIIMGVCTVGMGLVPGYKSIGFLAPVIVLILRLLQGLALGGEYGGAATYVAEHSPENRRGFMTSWIQATTGLAFILSITVILFIKSFMTESDWQSWGWRVPFIASVFLVGVSIYIRNKMSESPLFAEAKAQGKTSKNPIRESFGNKDNLKIVLLALFGLTIGGGTIGWITFYAQSFMLKTLMINFDQANAAIIIGILLGIPFFFFFGWLSDKIGRKGLLMFGMLLGIIAFRPIFNQMYRVADLSLKTEIGTKVIKSSVENTEDGIINITSAEQQYHDGTLLREVSKSPGVTGDQKTEIKKTIILSNAGKWKLILLVFSLQFIFTMAYGPLGAFMVEMFPLKIRYTSISFPYHFGFGIFGGLAPYFATYLVDKAAGANKTYYYLSGLNYPILLTGISIVIGVVYINENNSRFSIHLLPAHLLNVLRKWLGLVWILLSIAVAWFGIIKTGIPNMISGHNEDIVFGVIITFIITPALSIGLFIFGKYALQNEYDQY